MASGNSYEFRAMTALVQRVIEARRRAAETKAAVGEAWTEFMRQSAGLYEADRLAADECAAAENDLREAALTEFKQSGDKHPAPGVAVRLLRKLRYDEEQALAFALRYWMAQALTLDRRGFEEMVKDLDGARDYVGPRPDFVTRETVPQVTLASDFERALAGPVERLTADDLTPEGLR